MKLRPKYFQILLSVLKEKSPLVDFDLFIKLTDEKFVKIFGHDSVFDQEFITKLELKKLDALYCLESDHLLFQERLLIQSPEKEENPTVVRLEKIKEIVGNFENLKRAITSLGINPQHLEAIQRINQESYDLISTHNQLKELLKLKEKGISYAHTILVSTIAGHAAFYHNRSENTKKMISLASLLHDITLTEEEFIESLRGPFPPTNRRIKLHPIEAAEYSSLMPEKHLDLQKIIIQHHETSDMKGYPYKIGYGEVVQLSAIFILVDRFVDKVIETDFNRSDVFEILRLLSKDYSNGFVFSKALSTLKGIFNLN